MSYYRNSGAIELSPAVYILSAIRSGGRRALYAYSIALAAINDPFTIHFGARGFDLLLAGCVPCSDQRLAL